MSSKKMKMVTVIHADGRPDTVTTEPEPDMKRLQKLVGGFFELIPVFMHYNGIRVTWAYANEYGKLQDMPVNHRATAAWRACDPRITDHLRGDVVVIQSVVKRQSTEGICDECAAGKTCCGHCHCCD